MNATTLSRPAAVLALAAGLAACSGQTPAGAGFTPTAASLTQPDATPDKHHAAVQIFTANRDGGDLLGFKINANGDVRPGHNDRRAEDAIARPRFAGNRSQGKPVRRG